MADDWVFKLLADLRLFASANGLVAFAEQIEITERVAQVELEARRSGAMTANGAPPH